MRNCNLRYFIDLHCDQESIKAELDTYRGHGEVVKPRSPRETWNRRQQGNPEIIEVGGKRLSLTEPAKVLLSSNGFTKGQVIDYYAANWRRCFCRILRNHPLTLKRISRRRDQEFFLRKNATKHRLTG